MKVQLCAPSEPIILYPQATQAEDRGGYVRGFVEIDCPSDCKVEAMRLRLLAFHQIIGDPQSALHAEWATAESSYTSPPQTLFMREATLHDVKTDAEIRQDEVKVLTKGKHVLTFSLSLPAQSPASQHHLFRRVYYDLIFFIKGRPTKSFFSLPFTFAPIQPVHVECHPSPIGARGLNVLNVQLTPVHASPLRASIESNNARFGGCFTLRIEHDAVLGHGEGTEVTVEGLSLQLEQCWKVRGVRVEETRMQKEIATAKDFRRSNTRRPATHDEATLSVQVTPTGTNDRAVGPEDQKAAHAQNGVVLHVTKHDSEYHAYFPESESLLTVERGSDNQAPLRQWQATTPLGTTDDVKVEHTLTLSIDYSSVQANGGERQQKTAIFTSLIYLVKASMRTDALQLPQYSSVIEDLMNDTTQQTEEGQPAEQAPPGVF